MSEIVSIKIQETVDAILYTGKNLAEIKYACDTWGLTCRDCGSRIWVESEWLYKDWYLTRYGACWHKDSVSLAVGEDNK